MYVLSTQMTAKKSECEKVRLISCLLTYTNMYVCSCGTIYNEISTKNLAKTLN
jgi:hypothetical protein